MSDEESKKALLVALAAPPIVPGTATATGSTPPKADETAAIRKGIEQTRGQMSATVNQIEERLSPAHIEEQVAELKQSVLGNYHEAKDHLKEDLARELQGAKEKMKDEILEVKEQVRGEIDHARAAVREATVGRVENMVHDARDMVHNAGETVTGAGSSVFAAMKANPVPTALVALGVGWLIMSSRNASTARVSTRRLYAGGYDDEARFGYGGTYGRYDYEGDRPRGPRGMLRQGQRAVGDALHTAEDSVAKVGQRVQQGASDLAEGASGMAHEVGDRVGRVAHDMGERVSHLTDEVGHYAADAGQRGRRVAQRAGRQVVRVERSLEGTIRENPLAVGAVALAVGAAIALALPHTRQEDMWMGNVKDQLLDRAEDMAGEAMHKVEETVTAQLGAGEESGGQGPKNGLSGGTSSKNESGKSRSSSV